MVYSHLLPAVAFQGHYSYDSCLYYSYRYPWKSSLLFQESLHACGNLYMHACMHVACISICMRSGLTDGILHAWNSACPTPNVLCMPVWHYMHELCYYVITHTTYMYGPSQQHPPVCSGGIHTNQLPLWRIWGYTCVGWAERGWSN